MESRNSNFIEDLWGRLKVWSNAAATAGDVTHEDCVETVRRFCEEVVGHSYVMDDERLTFFANEAMEMVERQRARLRSIDSDSDVA